MPEILTEFATRLPANLSATFQSFRTPRDIQDYLDTLRYVAEERDRAPLDVMRDGQGHCLDGGFLAALALRSLGFPALVLDLVPEPGADDDHVLAVFQQHGGWGALAKSNFVGLRFRPPVYRTLRELTMSYFQNYFNTRRALTLRGYTRPLNLAAFDASPWPWDETAANRLYRRFYRRKAIPLVTSAQAEALHLLDERSYQADSLGADLTWAYGNRPTP